MNHTDQEELEARAQKLKQAGKGDLLGGDFNEKQSREQFQDAVAQWRTTGEPPPKCPVSAAGVQEAAEQDAAQPPPAEEAVAEEAVEAGGTASEPAQPPAAPTE